MEFLCSILGHQRSRKWARPIEGTWRSRCVRCGIRLQRAAPRRWVVIHGEEDDGLLN